MAGANPLLFGVAHDWDLLRTDDFGGTVPALIFGIRAEQIAKREELRSCEALLNEHAPKVFADLCAQTR